MALVKPFRALRYDPAVAGPLDSLVSPPHDVIGAEERARLLAASPYNAVRLVRPDDPRDAARDLAAWRDQGVLVRESGPAVWLLEEDFVGPDGVARTRRSLVARVRTEPYERGVVLPHERTFPSSKRTRLELVRATKTKLSPVLLLHHGPGPDAPPPRPPDLEATFGGVTARLWRLDDPAVVEPIRPPLVIADGHHRYETALRFHEEEGSEETGYVLAALVADGDPGLTIFPTHRLVAAPVPDLDGGFSVRAIDGDPVAALAELPGDRAGFVLLRREGALLAQGEAGGLDTSVVDRLPVAVVRYTPSAAEAVAAVTSGDVAAAFLVRPPTVAQVEAAARAGERMPEKSTYFFPKLMSGLLLSPFDE
jgi:uncharacterized protein (DUF1015 family)